MERTKPTSLQRDNSMSSATQAEVREHSVCPAAGRNESI